MDEEKQILDILQSHEFREQLPKVPRVERFQCEVYLDSTGDDAVRIWAIISESTPDSKREWKVIAPIEDAIRGALRKHRVSLFPYIEFVKQSELDEARKAQA